MLREAVRDACGVLGGVGKVAAAGFTRQTQDAQHMWQTSSAKRVATTDRLRNQTHAGSTADRPSTSSPTQSSESRIAPLVAETASRVNALAQGAFQLVGAQLRKSVPPPLTDVAGMILPERFVPPISKLSLKEHNKGVDDIGPPDFRRTESSDAPTSAPVETKAAPTVKSSGLKFSPTLTHTKNSYAPFQTVGDIVKDENLYGGRLRSIMQAVRVREDGEHKDGTRTESDLAALASHMPSISATVKLSSQGVVVSPGPVPSPDVSAVERVAPHLPLPEVAKSDKNPIPLVFDDVKSEQRSAPLPADSNKRIPISGQHATNSSRSNYPVADRAPPPRDVYKHSSFKSSPTSSAFSSAPETPRQTSAVKPTQVYGGTGSSTTGFRQSDKTSTKSAPSEPAVAIPINKTATTGRDQSLPRKSPISFTPEPFAPQLSKSTGHTVHHLDHHKQKLGERARQRAVPSSRLARLASFGSLAAGLGIGTVAETARRVLSFGNNSSDSNNSRTAPKQNATATKPAGDTSQGDESGGSFTTSAFLSEANAERIVNTLCKVRGAALKLGQMMSLQDESMLSPQLQRVFERVRQSADFMPEWQMRECLERELGADWRSKFADFDETPFAAASIGQVHSAKLHDGREVALKIQYPGVADGINSDIDNIMSIMKYWNILPKGLYVDSIMKVARQELTWECDYIREAKYMKKFRAHLEGDPVFFIPEVIDELSTKHLLTTELIYGVSLDKMIGSSQAVRNQIALNIIRLCLDEVFEFRLMQTDPNWANFFFDEERGRIYLLDFGATREFDKQFTDGYIQVIKGAAERDRAKVLDFSKKLGFLTGYETKEMQDAHVDAVMILGEGFTSDKPFDFGTQNTTRRIQRLIPIMMEQRLTPPPEESYSLHRKTSGCFLLCAKLGARVRCKPIFDRIWERYESGSSGSTTHSSSGWTDERRDSMSLKKPGIIGSQNVTL